MGKNGQNRKEEDKHTFTYNYNNDRKKEAKT